MAAIIIAPRMWLHTAARGGGPSLFCEEEQEKDVDQFLVNAEVDCRDDPFKINSLIEVHGPTVGRREKPVCLFILDKNSHKSSVEKLCLFAPGVPNAAATLHHSQPKTPQTPR